MKKYLFTMILCTALAVIMFPSVSHAQGNDWSGFDEDHCYFGFNNVSDNNGEDEFISPGRDSMPDAGKCTWGNNSGILSSPNSDKENAPTDWTWQIENVGTDSTPQYDLTLNNFHITSHGDYDTFMTKIPLKIILIGENSITSTGKDTTALSAYKNCPLVIKGDGEGSLRASSDWASGNGVKNRGINVMDTLQIDGGMITAIGEQNGVFLPINPNSPGTVSFILNGGSLTAKGGAYGLTSESIVIRDGSFTAEGGTQAFNYSYSFTCSLDCGFNTNMDGLNLQPVDPLNLSAYTTYKYFTCPVSKVATPVFTSSTGTYSAPFDAGITCTTENSEIRYTVNLIGSIAYGQGNLYNGPISLPSDSNVTYPYSVTLVARAFKPGMLASDEATISYTLTKVTAPSNASTQDTNSSSTLYEVTGGQNSIWTLGNTAGLCITSNADYSKFTGVWVDGTPIAGDNFTAQSGSTIVTLKSSYLQTLTVGEHTLRINSTDGYAETRFTITATAEPPKTGDYSNSSLWLMLMLGLSAVIGSGLLLCKKQRSNN